MVKYNYFENLEQLSDCATRAVGLACGSRSDGEGGSMSAIRRSCDRIICELEDALFSDFLPPLERDNIAACAHCLSRVVDQATELLGNLKKGAVGARINEEARICVELAERLRDTISLLRHIRKPDETPDVQGFRKLLAEGRQAHATMLGRLHTGVLPHSYAQTIILTGRLRAELSHSFDELVEVMLNNI